MLADKTADATVDGLNQKFLLVEENGRTHVKIANGTDSKTIGEKILCKIDVEEPVKLIHDGRDLGEKSRAQIGMKSFEEEIEFFASHHEKDERIAPEPDSKCKGCEFRISSESSKKSGFNECWAAKLTPSEVEGPFVFDIWNFRKSEALIADKRPLMRQVKKDDIKPESDDKPGISASERQWIQVELTQKGTKKPYVDTLRNWEGATKQLSALKRPPLRLRVCKIVQVQT